uniref:uncharacterized protein isoform X2 n=1 Tax=Semicossyphus pulcher TaxID=241346 RepID=UPI0037E82BD5
MSGFQDLQNLFRRRLLAAVIRDEAGQTTISGYEEELHRQRKLLDVILTPEIKLRRAVRVVDRRRLLALYLLLRRRRQRRIMWVHPINKRRQELGAFHHLVAELFLGRDCHLKYFRMSPEKMYHLLSLIGPDLTPQTTNFRESIQPKQRLAVSLRFLATGETFANLAFQYRLGKSTVASSVHITCRAIERRMMETQFPRPTEQMWRDIAFTFWTKWNFPNCLGAIDGKHVNITAPPKSGSLYFNYKKTFSIVLLALVDADYRFISIQVGDFGRASDGGVFSGSDVGIGMENKTLQEPGSGQQGPVPFTMVGDAAFPLKTYLMRPSPGQCLGRWKKIFNYRLSGPEWS